MTSYELFVQDSCPLGLPDDIDRASYGDCMTGPTDVLNYVGSMPFRFTRHIDRSSYRAPGKGLLGCI